MVNRKRIVPLINLVYSLVAIGETIRFLSLGDIIGAKDSALTAIQSGITGFVPYLFKGNSINIVSAIYNGLNALTGYLTPQSPYSLTSSTYPMVAMYLVGINCLEVLSHKELEEKLEKYNDLLKKCEKEKDEKKKYEKYKDLLEKLKEEV